MTMVSKHASAVLTVRSPAHVTQDRDVVAGSISDGLHTSDHSYTALHEHPPGTMLKTSFMLRNWNGSDWSY